MLIVVIKRVLLTQVFVVCCCVNKLLVATLQGKFLSIINDVVVVLACGCYY